MKSLGKLHPATLYTIVRHHVFSVFEKTGDIDGALAVMSQYSIPRNLFPNFYSGLRAELIVYANKRTELKLEPLLDAGVKADFSGVRKGRPINVDVTTNLDYKDINHYAGVTRKRGKLYEIALVNLKTEDIEFFPLRFPICPDCGNFSHYVVFLGAPDSAVLFWASEWQITARHCPHCLTFERVSSDNHVLHSPLVYLENLDEDDTPSDLTPEKYLAMKSIPIATFFEKVGGKIVSALAEQEWELVDKHGEAEWDWRLLWKHALAKDIDASVIADANV